MCTRAPVPPQPCQHLLLSGVLIIAFLMGMQAAPGGGFDLHSQKQKEYWLPWGRGVVDGDRVSLEEDEKFLDRWWWWLHTSG